MVLDLNNYTSIILHWMPYLVNKENQNNLAYLDFSKYQGLFKQVDYKKFNSTSKHRVLFTIV